MSDITEKEERQNMREARFEVHTITREKFDMIRSDLWFTAPVLYPFGRKPRCEH